MASSSIITGDSAVHDVTPDAGPLEDAEPIDDLTGVDVPDMSDLDPGFARLLTRAVAAMHLEEADPVWRGMVGAAQGMLMVKLHADPEGSRDSIIELARAAIAELHITPEEIDLPDYVPEPAPV